MSTSATITTPLIEQSFGRRIRPSDLQRTLWDWHCRMAWSRSPGLRAQVSQRGSTISQQTV